MVKDLLAAEAAQTGKLYSFRYRLDGKEVGVQALDDVLKSSRDLEARRRAWESSKAVGGELKSGLAQLRDLGCNHGQGYLLSRPLASDALGNLLARSTVQLPSPKHGILLDHRRAAS